MPTKRPSSSPRAPNPAVTREAEFQTFFAMAGVGNAIVDVETRRFVRVNRRFEAMTGYSARELEGLTFSDITHPEDRAGDEARFHELVTGQAESCHQEKRYVRKGGDVVWVDLTTTVIRDPRGRARLQVGVASDITAQHEVREELASLHQQLHRLVDERTTALADKTAQLESFVYTVGHDLRAPLRAINGYAEFISEDHGTKLTPGSAAYLERIKKAARRLDGLIRDLLTYTRTAEIELRIDDLALSPVIGTALASLRDEIAARQATVAIKTPLPSVRGEPVSLEQVLTHLLANAIKFVAPGIAPRVEIFAEVRGEVVRVSVTDNGIGIAPEFHGRIFRMFERLENARGYPGTGVGLPIVHRTIARLGGKVGLDSAVGGGSTFWFELPGARA